MSLFGWGKKMVKSRSYLPRQDPQFHHYVLEDGSRIYPSLCSFHHDTKTCRWFVWRRHCGIDGEILLTPKGIRYFDRPEQALDYLRAHPLAVSV